MRSALFPLSGAVREDADHLPAIPLFGRGPDVPGRLPAGCIPRAVRTAYANALDAAGSSRQAEAAPRSGEVPLRRRRSRRLGVLGQAGRGTLLPHDNPDSQYKQPDEIKNAANGRSLPANLDWDPARHLWVTWDRGLPKIGPTHASTR